VGRTARAELTGDAITLVSPQEESDLAAIERHMGKRLPREKVEGFDYSHKPEEKLEVPLAERIAVIRARKSEERARAKAKLARRGQQEATQSAAKPARKRTPDAPGPRPARSDNRRPEGRGEERGNREARPVQAHAGPHARATTAPGHPAAAPHGPRADRDRQRPGFHPRGPNLPAVAEDENRGNRTDGKPHLHAGPPPSRPYASPRPEGRRPDKGRATQGGRPQDAVVPTSRSGGFSFIRSSRFVDDGSPRPSADTSGVREDLSQSHKHDAVGRSNWGKTWQEKAKSGWKPTDAEPE